MAFCATVRAQPVPHCLPLLQARNTGDTLAVERNHAPAGTDVVARQAIGIARQIGLATRGVRARRRMP